PWPTRRALRLPRVAHPTPPAARQQTAIRLHLSLPHGAGRGEGEGAGGHRADHEPVAGPPAAPAELGAAGLGLLLSAWGIEQDLRLPGRLCLAAGDPLAVPQAPAHPLGGGGG